MTAPNPIHAPPASRTAIGRLFPVTRWDLVAQAGEAGGLRDAALNELCRLYWYPVYAYLRRHGYGRSDAEDLTQGFFVKLLADETIKAADSEKGTLRTFLLSSLQRHIADRARHDTAQKRGGGRVVISFDGMEAEERYASEPPDNRDPESLFAHAWAQGLLGTVRRKLQAAFEVSGRARVFETLLPFLMWDREPPSHREVAQQMGCTEAASRVHIMRLRRKFRDLLKAELLATVQEPEEVTEEINWLRSVLAGN
jgi:RNA polymerase sigma factor (sigma-70 family)